MGVPIPLKKQVTCPRCFFYIAQFRRSFAFLGRFLPAAGIALQRKKWKMLKKMKNVEKKWKTPEKSQNLVCHFRGMAVGDTCGQPPNGPSRLWSASCVLAEIRDLMFFCTKWPGPAGTTPWHHSCTPRKTMAALRAELSLAHSLRTVAGMIDPACERRARPRRRAMILCLIRGTPINGKSRMSFGQAGFDRQQTPSR